MNPQTDTGRERQWVQFRQTSIGPSDRHLKKRNVGQERNSEFSSVRHPLITQTDT